MIERRLRDGVLTVTLARPEKLNALSPALVQRLGEALGPASTEGARVVVLRGAGRCFCAGADVGAALGLADGEAAAAFLEGLAEVLARISSLPLPVIAAVQGEAVGGGAELALEADLRVLAEDARISFPDTALGSTPASLYALVRLVGRGRAAEMALLGTPLGAAEMLRLGAAHEVVPAAELGAAAQRLAERLRDRCPAHSARFAKRALRLAEESSREADLRANAAAMLACYGAPEQRAFVRRFLAAREEPS